VSLKIMTPKRFTGFIVIATLMATAFAQHSRTQKEAATSGSPATRQFSDCPNCPVMVILPPGTFAMGSPQSEVGRVRNDESPVHEVNIRSFAIGKFEVTVAEFSLFLGERGLIENTMARLRTEKVPIEFHQEDNHPVVNISWDEARDYTIWLSRKTGKVYRLPSEAEWEYAARAGTQTAYYWGNNPDDICEYENVLDMTAKSKISWASKWNMGTKCSDGYAYTAPVGSFKPNPFGLYDMLGNAQEWVADCQHKSRGLKDLTLQSDTRDLFYAFVDYYGAPSDGSVWEGGDCSISHMVRGGTWRYPPSNARAASRGWGEQNYRGDPARGFRVARTL
jgi:formylglycine-generating enzyme required for sulfatase activity